jgi:Leucine-rich repeat (LRR) protein
MFDITTKLNTLYIHFNKITAIPKHIFDHLNNLEWLDLSYNQITAIPEHTFDSLISLLYLNLSYNQIMEIPKHLFDSLTNLNSLYFHDNKITVIPEHIFDKFINLQTLFIDNNQTTTMPEHIFDQLIKLQALDISRNKITAIPISILSCRLLLYFNHRNNPIERIDVRIQRFIDHMQKYRFNENIQNYGIFKDSQNLLSSSIHYSHSSVKNSINNLMRDTFTMDKEDIIKQLIEESPNCLQSLLCYLDDKNVHSTLYLTFFEVFVKVWGRIIGSDFKADLIKRLDKEIMESEYKSFTGRISRLLNVLVGYFGDINVTISNSERISTIISSVLNGREMSEEIKEKCREYLKKADIEEDEIEKSLDV